MKALLPILPVIFLVSCGGEAPRPAVQASTAPPPAHTAAVQTQQWPTIYEATGTVRARSSTAISSKMVAYIQKVNAQLGDHVAAGQVLATLEVRDLDAAIRSAETARAEVLSATPEAESAIAAAKANLDLAQSTYRRMQDLASKKSISDQEFDEASARLKAAQASYEMARARRAQLDSRLAQADQGVSSARVMKDYAQITAPVAGTVTAKTAEPGALAAPGAPLFTIEREGALRLEASVDESRLSSIKVGQPAEVTLDALARVVTCNVSEIVPDVDAASRTATVKIDLPSLPQLRSGMFGRATFQVGSRPVVVIPASALTERGQLQSVQVVEGGTARSRLVTTGRRSQNLVEVLSGLNPGETVVTPQ